MNRGGPCSTSYVFRVPNVHIRSVIVHAKGKREQKKPKVGAKWEYVEIGGIYMRPPRRTSPNLSLRITSPKLYCYSTRHTTPIKQGYGKSPEDEPSALESRSPSPRPASPAPSPSPSPPPARIMDTTRMSLKTQLR